jgi:hypothetical protein
MKSEQPCLGRHQNETEQTQLNSSSITTLTSALSHQQPSSLSCGAHQSKILSSFLKLTSTRFCLSCLRRPNQKQGANKTNPSPFSVHLPPETNNMVQQFPAHH